MSRKYEKINFWASISSTILALFLVVLFFASDICREEHSKIQQYVSRIDALKYELATNYLYTNEGILSGKEGYLECKDVPQYRYFTSTLNGILNDGIISDLNISQDLMSMYGASNDNNRILDSADSILREQLTLETEKSVNRCKEYMKAVIVNAEDLDEHTPITIKKLGIHQNKTIKSVNPSYCKLLPFKKKIEFLVFN